MKTINKTPTECVDCKNKSLVKDAVKASIPGQNISCSFLCTKCELLMIVKPPPKTMFEELKETVAFIYTIEDKEMIKPIGTGFFIKIPIEHIPNAFLRYFVTAKHVTMKNDVLLSEIIIRMNNKDGGISYTKVSLDTKNIFQHDEKEVDLVVMIVPINDKQISFKSIPLDIIFTHEQIIETGIGAGDEAFFSGLFEHHLGTNRNEPIYRFGKISLINDEKIGWKEAGKIPIQVNLYLIDCDSFGGNSGSPVFFKITPQHTTMQNENSFRVCLGGILKGSYVDHSKIISFQDGLSQESMAITAVTPAYKLRELLFSNDVLTHRKSLQLESTMDETSNI